MSANDERDDLFEDREVTEGRIAAQHADTVRDVLDSLPEKFWFVTVWTERQNWLHARMDVADRKRIVTEILQLIDGSPEAT